MQNFNLLGIILMVAIIVGLNAIDFSLEWFVDFVCFRGSGRLGLCSRTASKADDKLQLLRMALPAEYGTKRRLDSSGVPVLKGQAAASRPILVGEFPSYSYGM